ncbi:OmpA family protein [Paracoccus sp. (in: a-proteobacteria)]|uniref:OmpA family protein n=1 Tax=Paracoccus sp. TaxID=267 RepID=UPI0035B48236
MRRIYRTTTALVASLAIVTPQLSLAQAEQQVLPQAEAPEQLAAEAAAPETAPEPAAPEAEAAPEQEAPEQEAAEPAAEQPQEAPAEAAAEAAMTSEPAAEAADTPPAEAAPEAAEKAAAEPMAEPAPPEGTEATPEPLEAKEPQAKPLVVDAAAPTAKPEDAAEAAARTEQMADEAKKQPAPKPAKAEAKTATDEDATEALREKLEAKASDAQDGAKDKAQRPQTEAQTSKAPAEKPADAPKADAQPAETMTTETAPPKKAVEDKAGEAKESKDKAAKAVDDDTEALRKQLEEKNAPKAATSPETATGTEPAEMPAPEAQAKPNAVAKRAAEEVAPVTAAALQAEPGKEGKGEVVEQTITQDNARSSAQEFATAVTQGLQAAPEPEARKKDDDDSGRDLAKLLLAGAAGFAVGKMLSNDRQVALNTGDRVVVTLPDGSQQVIKDENALLYRPGSNVQTETFQDGSTRSTVLREDGSRVVTIRDANMNILRRTLIRADGSETQLIDDTEAKPVRIADLPKPPPVRSIRGPMSEDALREALRREAAIDRRFSLGQIRDIPEVRALVAPVNVPEITFDTGSAAITPDQAQQLATLGKVIRDSIARNPDEIYMIEGYTDAIGSNAANLALSDRRAESVALALTEYFQVPPENMVVQGYGEQFLLIPTEAAERENRRVAVRRITELLAQRN